MPRRAAALATPAASTPLTDVTHNPQQDDPFAAEVSLLRRQWKWAAFSQFFYTFAPLFAIPDVSLTDIEDDLTRSTSIVIHRVMHRLLVAATQDRKLSLENWQTSLRKQYKKRDPDLNPIGPEPVVQLPTPAPDSPLGPDDEEPKAESVSTPGPSSDPRLWNAPPADTAKTDVHEFKRDHSGESSADLKLDEMKVESTSVEGTPLPEFQEESKDWLTLPMLTKLDSLHHLTEWQFHNVNRLRTIMKDDDETAQWRIEPIGYDTKANAYWLIGPDRLWIQRDIPKPPRKLKRKRSPAKPKPKRPTIILDDESDTPPAPKKSKAISTARSSTMKTPAITPKTPTRSTRTRRPPSSPEDLGPITSRGPRAAKMQASVKLSAQAKELAELQRQAALESRRSGKRVFVSPSPPQRSSSGRAMGTRMSARLRGVSQGDEEWQEIPDEWLKEPNEAEEDGSASGSERLDGEAEMDQHSDPDPSPELEPEAVPDPDTDTQRTKTGLESDDDAVSELTELSENSPPATILVSPFKARKSSKKGSSSRRKTSRSKRQSLVVDDVVPPVQPSEEVEPEEEIELEWHPPDDFVEWETICVTLYDWEHICERFEGATHYTEKALYKLLSQHIAPEIIAELREVQRKRQLDEAVSQRKRSSRLAMKESEKEEARLAALRKAEEEEKLSRVRRLEARLKREEEERLKREVAREKRRLDREERERRAQAGEGVEETGNASSSIDIVGDDPPLQRKAPATKALKGKPGRPRTKTAASSVAATPSASASGSRTPVGEDWMLDCEICLRVGVNKDDGSPLLCCGKCSKWQHIACHDAADRKAGHPKRNWDREEFICRACRLGPRRSIGLVNGSGRQSAALNGSSSPVSTSYDVAGRTPSPYYPHQSSTAGYTGQIPYNGSSQNHPHPSSHPRTPYQQQHSAITFSHYQPQQCGFTTNTTTPHSSALPHAQVAMSQASSTLTPYAQSHYNSAHGSSSKLTQYPNSQYPPHLYSNGTTTTWPAVASSPSHSSSSAVRSGVSWSTHPHAQQQHVGQIQTQTTGYPAVSSVVQNGNGNPATATTSAVVQSQPWRGNSYVAPIGGGSSISYYSQSSQSTPPPQHRAP